MLRRLEGQHDAAFLVISEPSLEPQLAANNSDAGRSRQFHPYGRRLLRGRERMPSDGDCGAAVVERQPPYRRVGDWRRRHLFGGSWAEDGREGRFLLAPADEFPARMEQPGAVAPADQPFAGDGDAGRGLVECQSRRDLDRLFPLRCREADSARGDFKFAERTDGRVAEVGQADEKRAPVHGGERPFAKRRLVLSEHLAERLAAARPAFGEVGEHGVGIGADAARAVDAKALARRGDVDEPTRLADARHQMLGERTGLPIAAEGALLRRGHAGRAAVVGQRGRVELGRVAADRIEDAPCAPGRQCRTGRKPAHSGGQAVRGHRHELRTLGEIAVEIGGAVDRQLGGERASRRGVAAGAGEEEIERRPGAVREDAREVDVPEPQFRIGRAAGMPLVADPRIPVRQLGHLAGVGRGGGAELEAVQQHVVGPEREGRCA